MHKQELETEIDLAKVTKSVKTYIFKVLYVQEGQVRWRSR